MDVINDVVMSLAASPWVLLIVFLVVAVDGFFPPIPSESIVVALAALAASGGSPNMWLLIVAAALGAVAGDHAAYGLGRLVGVDRIGWMRRPRVAKAVAWAQRGLNRRAATLILTARFIPVGRVAVNMTAGATKFSRRRFLVLTLVAGTCWSLYSVAIGLIAGAWLTGNPVLGAVLAVVVALVLGILLDFVIASMTRYRDARRATASVVDEAHDIVRASEDGAASSAESSRADSGPQPVRR